MKNFVRIIGFILVLSSTIMFVLKLMIFIPIENRHLLVLFIIGAICIIWANFRNKPKEERIRRF